MAKVVEGSTTEQALNNTIKKLDRLTTSESEKSIKSLNSKNRGKNSYAYPSSEEPEKDSFAYWTQDIISKGIQEGTILEGAIRINQKNYNQAFIPHPNNYIDVYIPWRNRALNGDIVAVYVLDRQLHSVLTSDVENYLKENKISTQKEIRTESGTNSSKPDHLRYVRVKELLSEYPDIAALLKQNFPDSKDSLPDRFIQPIGVVVSIIQKVHPRVVAGYLTPRTDKNPKYAFFKPFDSRIPRIDVPMKECPAGFKDRPQDFKNTLFICELTEWNAEEARAKGKLKTTLGLASEIEPMTEAILMEQSVETSEFDQEALDCLPKDLPWTIPPEEFQKRRDFTKECIFSIDPSTARDLDDALSCKQLDDDTYEIGVHIADVSYFVTEKTALDKCAGKRATTVYMVQRVIPMLPRLLCEQLCSLNPNEERLAFSVVWHIDITGRITDEWFGRTVIKSCAKLSYDHAQGFINEPDREWTEEELPPITNGYKINDVKQRVLTLDKIARCLRKKRFENGALRLDNIKLSYTLNRETGYPSGFFVYEIKDSNRLIEEYMLLTNIAVARKIHKAYPKFAILRRHPVPQGKQLSDLETLCKSIGLYIDSSSSGTIQESLNHYLKESGDGDDSAGRLQILTQMCIKPMQQAKYFCSGKIENEELYRHYALAVPYYTHFTSPIRRYADIMVHRQLAAALGYTDIPNNSVTALNNQAEHCNTKKENAKIAGDLSAQLFFIAFLRTCGRWTEKAMILKVLDMSVDVVFIKLGYKKRVYIDATRHAMKSPPLFKDDGKDTTLVLTWPALGGDGEDIKQSLGLFDVISCELMAGDDPLQFQAYLLHPSLFTREEGPQDSSCGS